MNSHSPSRHETIVVDYGRSRWTLAYERHPRFHRDVVVPQSPFDVFEVDSAQAGKLVESSFFIAKKADIRNLSYLTYAQASILNEIAAYYSVFLWVRAHHRLPDPQSTNRIEKSVALLIASIERKAKEFSRLQDDKRDVGLRKTASRLASVHYNAWKQLRRVLAAAIDGYTEQDLACFNRYQWMARKIDDQARHELTDEDWAYVLGGPIDARRFGRIVSKIERLVGSGKIVLDRETGRYVPAVKHTPQRTRGRLGLAASELDPSQDFGTL